MKIVDLFFGHKRVEHEDGRVEHITRKEAFDAVDRGNAQVESGDAPQRQQEGSEGDFTEAGSSSDVVGETGGKTRKARVQSKEV